MGLHFMGATLLSTPELKIDEQEAKLLADAVNDVGQYYNVVLDPKAQAWINLGMAFSTVYGTRAMAIKIKRDAARRAKTPKLTAVAKPEPQPGAQPAANNPALFTFTGPINPTV